MIDRIEQILSDIYKELDVEDSYTYKGIFFSRDDWRFIYKCLANYQMLLVKEISSNDSNTCCT